MYLLIFLRLNTKKENVKQKCRKKLILIIEKEDKIK